MSVGQWIVFGNGVAKAVSRSNFRSSFRGKDWRLHGACTLMIVVVVRRASDGVPGMGRLEPITATLLSYCRSRQGLLQILVDVLGWSGNVLT